MRSLVLKIMMTDIHNPKNVWHLGVILHKLYKVDFIYSIKFKLCISTKVYRCACVNTGTSKSDPRLVKQSSYNIQIKERCFNKFNNIL